MEQIDRVQVKEQDVFFWEFVLVPKKKFDDIYNDTVLNIFAGLDELHKKKLTLFDRMNSTNRYFVFYHEIGKNANYIVVLKVKEAIEWKKYNLTFMGFSDWFRKVNGATVKSAAKPLGAVRTSNTDEHVMKIMKELYQDPTYDDDSGVELTKLLLQNDKTLGIDLDLFHYLPSTNEYLLFEFLYRDKKQSVTTITSHPMRYAWNSRNTDNRRKFISLWNIRQKLNGRLYLINYSENLLDKISIIEVLDMDEKTGIHAEIKCCMNYNVFIGWLKDLMVYGGNKKDYLADFECVKYDENFFVEFDKRKNEYGRVFSTYYERLLKIEEIR